jgi:uncharacterized protein YceH (UPF0502 family)
MTSDTSSTEGQASARWRPLEAIERRVLGVLIEKAKTTPENYPLSLNSLRSGCNQKNNRAPLMQVEESQVEEALDGLRQAGAIAVVQGTGRVDKYRHLAYEWLGVEKVELAVMAELLLRGSQTVGELRGRAARMEPIKDLGELTPILDSLQAKGLIQFLTPAGRGSVVTHALYLDREMEKVRREALSGQPVATMAASDDEPPSAPAPRPTRPASGNSSGADNAAELGALRDAVSELKQALASLRAEFESTVGQLRRELDDLNRQLGN